jgi:hypothetical protein
MWQPRHRGNHISRENGSRPARACAVGPALTLQRLTRLNIRDDRVDLDTIQRALDPQYDGQSHHYVSIGHQQIVCSDLGITVTVLDRAGLHPMSETQ